MSDDQTRRVDDEALFAYLDGELDLDAREELEERLRASDADRARLELFQRDMRFMRESLDLDTERAAAAPSIERRIARRTGRAHGMRTLAAAASLAVLAGAVFTLTRSTTPTLPANPALGEAVDTTYLHAAVAQLDYEITLLHGRALRAQGVTIQPAFVTSQVPPAYGDPAAVLLESARYWASTGGDPALSRARYQEVLDYFPDSAAAAAARDELPANGNRRID